MRRLFLCPFIAIALLGTTSRAMFEIRIDLSTDNGAAAYEGTWNVFNSTSQSDVALVDLNGDPTGLTYSDTFNGNNGNSSAWTGATGAWLDDTGGDDLFFTTNSSATVTFDGMGTGQWNVEVASAWNSTAVTSTFTIGGNTANRTGTGDSVSTPWIGSTDGADNWLIWDNVTPNSGTIAINVTKSGSAAGISAIRLTSVPEPKVYAILIGLAAVGLALHRRIRRQRSA